MANSDEIRRIVREKLAEVGRTRIGVNEIYSRTQDLIRTAVGKVNNAPASRVSSTSSSTTPWTSYTPTSSTRKRSSTPGHPWRFNAPSSGKKKKEKAVIEKSICLDLG